MSKKTYPNEDDKAAFDEAMRGVKRLSHTKIVPPQKIPVRKKSTIKPREIDDPYFIFSDYEKLEAVDSQTLLEFSRPGLQHKILRNLRTGQYNIEATLDLHGMTVEEAKHAVSRFLAICKNDRIRYALIIHGKGRSQSKPVLKNKLNHWLRQPEDVLAFCSAIAKDGSTGALYVLLRR